MKLILAATLFASATAFAPTNGSAKATARYMADVAAPIEEIEEEPAFVYPTVNGWTAAPEKFCAGLPGAIAPFGNFDPLGFTNDLPVQEVKRFREAEVTHGRVAMLATVGYLVAENFHPLFNGAITGPANTHLAQVQATAPFFFAFLTATIAISEFSRANTGWEMPKEAMIKNMDVEGATWLSKLNDGYYPGDIGFDPLGLKPTDAKEFATMQEKELSNGRLAMLAAAGMIVQEQITHNPLLPLQF